MAFQPVTDGALVVIHGTGPSGVVYENTLGFILTVTLTQALTDTISNFIATEFSGNISDFLADTVEYTGVTVTDLRTSTGPQYDSVDGWPLAGASSGNALPIQTAGLISWNTDLRGRSYRGRMYIGGYSETYGDGAHMVSAAHTGLSDFAGGIVGNTNFGVISRRSAGVARDPAIITQITGQTSHDLWATQRRRAPR